MADLSLVTDKYFTIASETFADNLSSSIAAGAATVPVNNNSEYTNGDDCVITVDPGTVNEATFIGRKSGLNFLNCVWTEGNLAVGHSNGATVIDYDSATHHNTQSKGILQFANSNGSLKTAAVQTALNIPTNPTPDWVVMATSITSVTNNGNRSFTLVPTTDVTALVSPGMRFRSTRTVAANTYMGGAFNGTNQYFTKVTPTGTLSTITDNFTIRATVMPTAYASSAICGRVDATPNNGFALRMEADGRVAVYVFNGGTGNNRVIATYQSLPLNKKTHVAMSWTSGTVAIYFDGIAVSVAPATTGGTAPTTAGTGGDWSIGRQGAFAGVYFPGYISNVAVFNAVLSAATIKQYDTYKLTGSETNCIGAWALDNAATDQFAGTNNLTAQGSVGYSNISPFTTAANGLPSAFDYGIVQTVSASTIVVQMAEGCTIPTSGGVSAVSYSSVKSPFGFPAQRAKWQVETHILSDVSYGSGTAGTWYNTGVQINLGIGEWDLGYEVGVHVTHAGTGNLTSFATLSTANNSDTDTRFKYTPNNINISLVQSDFGASKRNPVSLAASTTYFMNLKPVVTGTTSQIFGAGDAPSIIRAENAYL